MQWMQAWQSLDGDKMGVWVIVQVHGKYYPLRGQHGFFGLEYTGLEGFDSLSAAQDYAARENDRA